MIQKIKKPVSILLSLIMVFSLFTIVPLSASAANWYYDLARGTLIRPGDTFSFEDIGSFKFADYNDPTIIHEVKGSDFSYNQATLSVTDGYYSFGSTKLLPTSVSPGGLLIADYDSTTKMATFGVQNITHSFDETTGTLTIGGTGVVPPNYAFTGSDVYDVVFTQSNLVKHLIIDATDMIAIKQDAFMAYTGGCVLEDVEINSTSSTPLIIESNAVFYESDNTVTVTVNAVELATVTNSPVNNYSTPVNLIYNVEQPFTFEKNALTDPWRDLTVTFPAGCKIFIPGGPQFTDSHLQDEYDMLAEYGEEEFFWRQHSDLVEGTDYVLGDARYEELTPLNASLVVGDDNTALFSAYTITDESVNGTVTASVNGTDVTEAAADADVLLTVAPDNGYQFKSISATYPKNKVEEFSDLVALMGDAVFSAADYADHPEYTCKVNDGKFVVYDGDTSVAELTEANMTNAELGGTYFSAQCGGLEWNLYLRDGIITDIYAYDSDYNYIFASADGSKSTGTLLPTVVNLTTVTEGSQYSLTMPKMPVTVTAEFEEAPAATASYVKVTSEPDDWSGDYLIVYEDEDESTAFNGSADELNSKGNYIDVTISGGEIESNAATDAAKVTIAQIDGGYSIATVGGAYIGGASGQNKLASSDDAIVNTISLEDDSAKIVSNTSTLRFNTTWVGFRYYKTVSQKPVQLYKLTGGSAPTTYTVTWKNGDDVLETDNDVAFGATPTYDGTTPYKADGANCIYTFSGWTPEVSAVTGDATYTAQFTESEKPETIKDCNNKYGNFRLYSNVPIVSFSNVNDLLTGAIIPITYGDSNTMIPVQDAKGYTYKFYDQTGTEIPAQIADSSSAPGSDYELSDDVTVYTNVINFTRPAGCTAIYIVATEPEAPAEFAPKHSVSVNGDVALNYYLNPDIVQAGNTINFTWTVNGVEKSDSYTLKASDDKPEGFMATVNVPAAEMTYDITASYGDYTDTFSVRRYCDVILSDEYETAYTAANGAEAYAKLENLVLNMLDYGAKAQTAFGRTEVDLANKGVEINGRAYTDVTDAMIDAAIAAAPVNAGKTSGDPAAVAETLGVKYYTTSLMFLTESTLRHIFTPATYPGEWGYGDLDGNQYSYYYFVQRENIPAAELDTLWTFEVGGQSFNYSALDYCKAILNSEMDGKYKDLAASTYWYNQAANALFDAAPAPVENVVDLSTLTGAYEAQDGDVLTGELGDDYQISIADGATVTLRDANITCLTDFADFAGITPLGDATILLEGENTVKGGYEDYPGIFVPENKTLTIDGTGSLTASSGGDEFRIGCGIGGGFLMAAGNIVINGGTITANGGDDSAAIGSGWQMNCGDITINGGTITAKGSGWAAGIGSGWEGSCGDITITGGTVTANGGERSAGIGSGYYGSCGNITIAATVTQVTATKGEDANSIGEGYSGSCGTISIADPSKVTQN